MDRSEQREKQLKQLKTQCRTLLLLVPAVLRKCFPLPDGVQNFEDLPEYKEAVAKYQEFEAKDGVDYSCVLAYARELAGRYETTDKSMDDKAGSIITYLSGGTAIITFGALLSIKIDNTRTAILGLCALLSLIPFLCFTILAVRAALKVRRPQGAASLKEVPWAIEMAEHYKTKEQVELNLWLMYMPICTASLHRNECKAALVITAHRNYERALASLVFPVAVFIVSLALMIAFPSSAQQPTSSPYGPNQVAPSKP